MACPIFVCCCFINCLGCQRVKEMHLNPFRTSKNLIDNDAVGVLS